MNRPHRAGLVVGKFCPLHLGHEAVIRRALEECETVWVVTYTSRDLGFPLAQRERWLKALSPRLVVVGFDAARLLGHDMVLPDDDADGGVHRDFVSWVMCNWVGAGQAGHSAFPEVVYTSEEYGDALAEHLAWRARCEGLSVAVRHQLVDFERRAVPISGTELRERRGSRPGRVNPQVARDLGRRVVLLGGESTGKTETARRLAADLGCAWVPEYGRQRWEERGGRLNEQDLAEIALTQARLEEEAPLAPGGWLVCDTSPLTTLLYAGFMFPDMGQTHHDDAMNIFQAAERRYDLTLLLTPEVPLVQDGTRVEDPEFRWRQHARYVEVLTRRRVPFTVIGGEGWAERYDRALAAVRRA